MADASMEEKNAAQRRAISFGSSLFASLFCAARLIAAYFFDVDVEGTSRRFGQIDVGLYWLLLAISVLLAVFTGYSYFKNRKK